MCRFRGNTLDLRTATAAAAAASAGRRGAAVAIAVRSSAFTQQTIVPAPPGFRTPLSVPVRLPRRWPFPNCGKLVSEDVCSVFLQTLLVGSVVRVEKTWTGFPRKCEGSYANMGGTRRHVRFSDTGGRSSLRNPGLASRSSSPGEA